MNESHAPKKTLSKEEQDRLRQMADDPMISYERFEDQVRKARLLQESTREIAEK